jgi:hypothetical protein
MSPVALQIVSIPSLIINLILPTTLTVAAVTQTSPSNSAIILPPKSLREVAPVLHLIITTPPSTLVCNPGIPRPPMHQVMALLLMLVRNLAILCPLVHHVLQAVAPASSRNTTTSLNWMEIPASHNSVVSRPPMSLQPCT